MSKARLVITAVVLEGRSHSEVARAYGVSQGWISRLVARYRQEGEAAFEPRSRRPRSSPAATPTHLGITDGMGRASVLVEVSLGVGDPRTCEHGIAKFLVRQFYASDVDGLEPLQLLAVGSRAQLDHQPVVEDLLPLVPVQVVEISTSSRQRRSQRPASCCGIIDSASWGIWSRPAVAGRRGRWKTAVDWGLADIRNP